jgi:hypothetical protein
MKKKQPKSRGTYDLFVEYLEEWRRITGFPDYEVSNLGRIRHVLKNGTVKYLKTDSPNSEGYAVVALCKHGRRYSFYAHRLVAEAFLEPLIGQREVNHLCETAKLCNEIWNLSWVTHSENINWGTANERRSKKLSKPVLQLTLDGREVKKWTSMTEAANAGYNIHCISRCCSGHQATHAGYRWCLE